METEIRRIEQDIGYVKEDIEENERKIQELQRKIEEIKQKLLIVERECDKLKAELTRIAIRELKKRCFIVKTLNYNFAKYKFDNC
ncbi:unnamed protein product [Rotaria magnacalcarata]